MPTRTEESVSAIGSRVADAEKNENNSRTNYVRSTYTKKHVCIAKYLSTALENLPLTHAVATYENT